MTNDNSECSTRYSLREKPLDQWLPADLVAVRIDSQGAFITPNGAMDAGQMFAPMRTLRSLRFILISLHLPSRLCWN